MNKVFASIKRGLRQAVRHQQGKRVAGLKLKAVRERTGRTKER